jgi:hypothetical protein
MTGSRRSDIPEHHTHVGIRQRPFEHLNGEEY